MTHQIIVQRRALTRRFGVRSICFNETFSAFSPVASDSSSLFSSFLAASICRRESCHHKNMDEKEEEEEEEGR